MKRPASVIRLEIRGPKKVPKKRIVTMRLDEDILADVEKLARQHSIPKQNLINAIIKIALQTPGFIIDFNEIK